MHTITIHKDKRIANAERPTIAYNELVTLLFRFPQRVELDKYTSWELSLDSDMRFFPGEDGLLAYSDEYTLDIERNTVMFTLNTRTAKFRDLVNGATHSTKIYLQLSAREGTDTPVHMVLDYVLASSIVNDAQGDPGTVPDLRSEMQGLVDDALQAREQSQAIYEGLIAVNTFMVGHAYNYGVTLEGTRVGICWTDPNDLVTQDLATIARWGKTRLLYKAGGFPEHEEDGVVLVDSVARDQYRETPFTHDFGSSGDYYFALFTCTTGGVWNTTDTAPRFTTDDLTWATIAMMTRTDTLLQYPGMEIGAVVDIQVSTMFPKLRYKLAHVNYDGGHARVRDFHYDHTKLFNSIWIPHLLPCLGDSNAALMLPFDAAERGYGRTWDEVFVTGKKYYKIVDFEYVELAEGTDYEPGGSVQEWAAAVGYDAYTKNHAQRTSTGSNSWKDSNMRQWLNSSGTGWFRQQNEYDVNGITQAGFLTGFDQDLLDLVQPVYNITARNTASALIGGGGGGFDTTLDRMWLPSMKEVFNTGSVEEGTQLSYFRDIANTDALRIQRDEGGTARGAWMRSPDAFYVHYANALNSSGGIGQWASVNTGQAFLPTLCIA